MDYSKDIEECYSSIMNQEDAVVNMQLSMGFAMDIRPLAQTLDNLKIMMVYAWERNGYGTYKDFFKGKELESKYLSFKEYPHEVIVRDFLKYLKLSHVRIMFDDDLKTLEKMKEILLAL